MKRFKDSGLLITSFVSTCLLSATTAMAASHSGDGKKSGAVFLPVLNDDNYIAQPTLSLIGGQLEMSDNASGDGAVAGIELSINCPLLKTPTNRIRQRISLVKSDEDDVELTSLEFNPHYMVPVNNKLEVGFGPGVGVINAASANDDDTVLGLSVGISADYRHGKFFVGADLRHQITTDGELDGNEKSYDNTRVLVKLGINF